jgi:hypothetical protein
MSSSKPTASIRARVSGLVFAVSQMSETRGQTPPTSLRTTTRTQMQALAAGKERGDGALRTKSCRGLLLYYSTCLYLLLLRLRLTMHGHALEGNERGWMRWQRERKRGMGNSHWNRGQKWNSKWCIYMKSERKTSKFFVLWFIEFSEVFALALDAMKKWARGNLPLFFFLPSTCLY